jgi:hypothetical protein
VVISRVSDGQRAKGIQGRKEREGAGVAGWRHLNLTNLDIFFEIAICSLGPFIATEF